MLPIALGLLGAGLAGSPLINDYLDRSAAVRRQRQYARGAGEDPGSLGMGDLLNMGGTGDPLRREGPGDTKFNESGAIFYGGNRAYDPNMFIDDRYDQDLQSQAEANARATASISAAPGMLNAQTNADRWRLDPMNPDGDNYNAAADPNSPAYDPTQDPRFRMWQAQEQFLRDNPNIDQQLRREEFDATTAALARQQGVDAAAGYVEKVEPLLSEFDEYNRVLKLMPDATRWTGRWLDTPEGANAAREVEQTLFELKQSWIQRQISFGREANDAIYKRADQMFPDSVGLFDSREKLERFIRTQQEELRRDIERERVRAVGNANGNPLGVLDTYSNPPPPGDVTSNTGVSVTPDG